jgi:hypothetical protein
VQEKSVGTAKTTTVTTTKTLQSGDKTSKKIGVITKLGNASTSGTKNTNNDSEAMPTATTTSITATTTTITSKSTDIENAISNDIAEKDQKEDLVNLETKKPTSSETLNDGLDSISMEVNNYSLPASGTSDTDTIGSEDNNTETTNKTENINASDKNDANKPSNVKDIKMRIWIILKM